MRVVVSLTTIPGRAALLARALASLQRQTRQPDAIYLWLPEERFGTDHSEYRFPGVTVRSGRDLGPAMKILPVLALETDPETCIIPIDDDVEYPPCFIEKLVMASALHPDHAIGFTGWILESGEQGANVRHLNEEVAASAMFQPVHVLEGYRGVLYRRRFFAMDIFAHLDALAAFRFHDDILLSGYLASRGIARIARWFGSEPAPATNRWTLHGQDSGLHTAPDWLKHGQSCVNYWSRYAPGLFPAIMTPAIRKRLQLFADPRPRAGFMHHGPPELSIRPDTEHDLQNLPWPWPNDCLYEILAHDPFASRFLEQANALVFHTWLRECWRILMPGGYLMFEIPCNAHRLPGAAPNLQLDAILAWLEIRDAPATDSFAHEQCTEHRHGWRFVWERDPDRCILILMKVPDRASLANRADFAGTCQA